MLVKIGIHYARLRHGFIVSAPHRTRVRQRVGYLRFLRSEDLWCWRILKFVLIGLKQFRLYHGRVRFIIATSATVSAVTRRNPLCSCINRIAQPTTVPTDCSDLINDRRRRGRRPTVLHLIKRIRHIGVDRSHRSKFTHGIRSNDQKDIIFS